MQVDCLFESSLDCVPGSKFLSNESHQFDPICDSSRTLVLPLWERERTTVSNDAFVKLFPSNCPAGWFRSTCAFVHRTNWSVSFYHALKQPRPFENSLACYLVISNSLAFFPYFWFCNTRKFRVNYCRLTNPDQV